MLTVGTLLGLVFRLSLTGSRHPDEFPPRSCPIGSGDTEFQRERILQEPASRETTRQTLSGPGLEQGSRRISSHGARCASTRRRNQIGWGCFGSMRGSRRINTAMPRNSHQPAFTLLDRTWNAISVLTRAHKRGQIETATWQPASGLF